MTSLPVTIPRQAISKQAVAFEYLLPYNVIYVYFYIQMMSQYAPFLYSIGLLDEKQRTYFQDMTDKATVYIRNKDFRSSYNVSVVLSKTTFYLTVELPETYLTSTPQRRGSDFSWD
jgi:hypothetical protein